MFPAPWPVTNSPAGGATPSAAGIAAAGSAFVNRVVRAPTAMPSAIRATPCASLRAGGTPATSAASASRIARPHDAVRFAEETHAPQGVRMSAARFFVRGTTATLSGVPPRFRNVMCSAAATRAASAVRIIAVGSSAPAMRSAILGAGGVSAMWAAIMALAARAARTNAALPFVRRMRCASLCAGAHLATSAVSASPTVRRRDAVRFVREETLAHPAVRTNAHLSCVWETTAILQGVPRHCRNAIFCAAAIRAVPVVRTSAARFCARGLSAREANAGPNATCCAGAIHAGRPVPTNAVPFLVRPMLCASLHAGAHLATSAVSVSRTVRRRAVVPSAREGTHAHRVVRTNARLSCAWETTAILQGVRRHCRNAICSAAAIRAIPAARTNAACSYVWGIIAALSVTRPHNATCSAGETRAGRRVPRSAVPSCVRRTSCASRDAGPIRVPLAAFVSLNAGRRSGTRSAAEARDATSGCRL